MRPSNDKEAVTLILDGLVAAGYTVVETADDTWNKDERVPTPTVGEAVDAVMAVDEAFVILRTPDSDETNAWIFFVMGNDPEEVAANYTVNLDPTLSNTTDLWS